MYVMILGVYYKLQTFPVSSGKRDYPGNASADWIQITVPANKSAYNKLYSYTLYLSAGIMLTGTLLCMFIPGTLLGLFTTNPDDHSRKYSTESSVSIYRIFRIHHFQWSTLKVLEKAYRR